MRGGGGIIREENMCFRTCIRVITIRGEKLVTKDKGGGGWGQGRNVAIIFLFYKKF